MTKKIKFIVIYTTGKEVHGHYYTTCSYTYLVPFLSDEDPDYPASELNTHGPTVHGWRSNVNCTSYPQELILKFHSPSSVARIQVLGHQFMIRE